MGPIPVSTLICDKGYTRRIWVALTLQASRPAGNDANDGVAPGHRILYTLVK
jgi:hypothetical protein